MVIVITILVFLVALMICVLIIRGQAKAQRELAEALAQSQAREAEEKENLARYQGAIGKKDAIEKETDIEKQEVTDTKPSDLLGRANGLFPGRVPK